MNEIKIGVTAPKGFAAAGIHAGLKREKKDMALVYSLKPAVVAGTFTTNKVKAAPVLWDMKIVREFENARAIVINSGNANACTGQKGLEDCEDTASYTASLLSLKKEEVLVASTGVIGVNLNMEKIKKGIDMLIPALSEDGKNAAEAIMTTDTFAKTSEESIEINGKIVTIGGMSKGSGMIHPNMATTLSFITTDASITKSALSSLLGRTVEDTYNMISVDGDTSTNDTVLVLANGEAGNDILDENSKDFPLFEEAFKKVLGDLAKSLVKDGEGASKFIEMKVIGAKSKQDAKILSRSVISSSLVKAAFFGSDANWGRILCSMGYSGADFDPSLVDLSFYSAKGTLEVMRKGTPIAFDEAKAKEILSEKEVGIIADCHQGDGEATAWGCDLTYQYVKINGDYRS